jgi:hypothetical protein
MVTRIFRIYSSFNYVANLIVLFVCIITVFHLGDPSLHKKTIVLFCVCLSVLSVVEKIDRRVVGWLMSDELENIWKEAALRHLMHYPDILLEELRKTMKDLS